MTPIPDRRRGRSCRRHPSRPAIPPGIERRQRPGCRRSLPLPRWRQWPSLLASALLGVGLAFALQAWQAQATAPPLLTLAPSPPPPRSSSGLSLAQAQALRDAACALTPAGVALDEHAHTTWLPRLALLQTAVADPRLPPVIRDELHETLKALQRLGITNTRPDS